MKPSFEYLLDKIEKASFQDSPFRHLEINEFLSDDHFLQVTEASEIDIEKADSSESLCALLLSNGYSPIKFPGCTTSIESYLKWKSGQVEHVNVDTCEGFGIAFRLKRTTTNIIAELKDFLGSEPFIEVLCRKFGIDRATVFEDVGIQKYLDGYEISPHPDIRKKALTFMVNINP